MHQSEAAEIILVEDNDYDAELTMRALRQGQITRRIRRLTNGQEALDYLFPSDTVSKIDDCPTSSLVLLDLKLPLVSGLEVLRAIKHDGRTKTMPVVVLTSSTEDQDINACYRLGVNSYIVKPVQFRSFMEAVQQLGLYWMSLNKFPMR